MERHVMMKKELIPISSFFIPIPEARLGFSG